MQGSLSPSIVSGLEDKLLFAPFHLASFLQNLKKVTLGVKLLQKSTKYLKLRVGITRGLIELFGKKPKEWVPWRYNIAFTYSAKV